MEKVDLEDGTESLEGKSYFSTPFGERRFVDDTMAGLIILSAVPYKNSIPHFILFLILSVLSCFTLPLFCLYDSSYLTRIGRKRLESARDGATHVLVQSESVDKKYEYHTCKVMSVNRDILDMISAGKKTIAEQEEFLRIQTGVPGNDIYFEWKHLRYMYNDASHTFDPFPSSLDGISFHLISEFSDMGRTNDQAAALQMLYGKNTTHTVGDTIFRFIFLKCMNPYYFLLTFSIIMMYYFDEVVQASIVLVLITASILWEVYIAWSTQRHIKSLFSRSGTIVAKRNNQMLSLDIEELVVGDLVYPDQGNKLPCDVILTQGFCAVDDSARTGEESPVPKLAVLLNTKQNEAFSRIAHKEHVLAAGSVIVHVEKKLEDQHPLEGVVCATGFSTDEGTMFRRILLQKSFTWKILKESFIIFLTFTVIVFVGLAYPVKYGLDKGASGDAIALSLMRVLARAFPPYLPIMLTVGAIVSAMRLKKEKIECIDPERLSLAGLTELAAFDKTGTLTDAGIEFIYANRAIEIMQGENNNAQAKTSASVKSNRQNSIPSTSEFVGLENILCNKQHDMHFERALATCHGCITIKDIPIGAPLDTKGIQASGWSIHEACTRNYDTEGFSFLPPIVTAKPPSDVTVSEVDVLYRTGFEAEERRQTVIAMETETQKGFVYMKGAPEQVARHCVPSSVPKDFEAVVKTYNKEGYYVIALAYKLALPEWLVETPERKKMESGLSFLGLALFRGNISRDTFLTIEPLVNANIPPVIVTGDSPHSGIYVARNGGFMDPTSNVILIEQSDNLILSVKEYETNSVIARTFQDLLSYMQQHPHSEFAITGAALSMASRALDDDELFYLIKRIKVYARIKPLQKVWVIRIYRENHLYTGMVGDGTNDCGALREADTSLALSKTEASTVATFTSLQLQVSDFINIMKEGRCALESTYVVIKYLIMYTSILLATYCASALNYSAFSNIMSIFDDIGLVLPLCVLMLLTKPSKLLNKLAPYRSAINIEFLFSFAGQVGIAIGFIIAVEYLLKSQDWFCSAYTALKALGQCINNPSPSCNPFPCYVFDPTNDLFISTGKGVGDGFLIYSYETTTWWQFTHFQIIGIAVIYNIRSLHRRSFIFNYGFSIYAVLAFITCSCILLIPYEGFQYAFPLVPYPEDSFRWKVWGYVWAYYASAAAWELVFVQWMFRSILVLLRGKISMLKRC